MMSCCLWIIVGWVCDLKEDDVKAAIVSRICFEEATLVIRVG